METDPAGLIEMGLVFGSLLVFLVWELVSLRRSQRRDADDVERRKKAGPENR